MPELLVDPSVIDLAKEHDCHYTVGLYPIKDVDGRVIPHRKGLVNEQTGDVYETVGLAFEPIQPLEVIQSLKELADASGGEISALRSLARIIRDDDGNTYSQPGYHIYGRVDLPKHIQIPGTDHIIQSRITCDLYQARITQRTKLQALVLICSNGMTGWRKKGEYRIRHSKNAHDRIKEIQKELAEMFGLVDELQEAVGQMVKAPVTDEFAMGFIDELLPIPKGKEEPPPSVERAREKVRFLFEYGKGNEHPAVRGSLWALYQGVTEYVDHYKSEPMKNNRREEYINFGVGADLKQDAWDKALALL